MTLDLEPLTEEHIVSNNPSPKIASPNPSVSFNPQPFLEALPPPPVQPQTPSFNPFTLVRPNPFISLPPLLPNTPSFVPPPHTLQKHSRTKRYQPNSSFRRESHAPRPNRTSRISFDLHGWILPTGQIVSVGLNRKQSRMTFFKASNCLYFQIGHFVQCAGDEAFLMPFTIPGKDQFTQMIVGGLSPNQTASESFSSIQSISFNMANVPYSPRTGTFYVLVTIVPSRSKAGKKGKSNQGILKCFRDVFGLREDSVNHRSPFSVIVSATKQGVQRMKEACRNLQREGSEEM
ncbi:hypothetical protein BLNAU_9004 [Blattamonas nauphoetae]|uniref:Uncharacterized protein n=1 Tax=Blattamonas nauphoetae TaxID=2049346 RepID=A0ABQ9XX17_9EUKA|nr:hypothetical protein BLNAU_9004 [Blattamonas nauphoetae]